MPRAEPQRRPILAAPYTLRSRIMRNSRSRSEVAAPSSPPLSPETTKAHKSVKKVSDTVTPAVEFKVVNKPLSSPVDLFPSKSSPHGSTTAGVSAAPALESESGPMSKTSSPRARVVKPLPSSRGVARSRASLGSTSSISKATASTPTAGRKRSSGDLSDSDIEVIEPAVASTRKRARAGYSDQSVSTSPPSIARRSTRSSSRRTSSTNSRSTSSETAATSDDEPVASTSKKSIKGKERAYDEEVYIVKATVTSSAKKRKALSSPEGRERRQPSKKARAGTSYSSERDDSPPPVASSSKSKLRSSNHRRSCSPSRSPSPPPPAFTYRCYTSTRWVTPEPNSDSEAAAHSDNDAFPAESSEGESSSVADDNSAAASDTAESEAEFSAFADDDSVLASDDEAPVPSSSHTLVRYDPHQAKTGTRGVQHFKLDLRSKSLTLCDSAGDITGCRLDANLPNPRLVLVQFLTEFIASHMGPP